MPHNLDYFWRRHDGEWRNPAQVVSLWKEAAQVAPQTLKYTVTGAWWKILKDLSLTLYVSREYEHLLMALSASPSPKISYFSVPHPSGLAVDPKTSLLYVASTRNPNQVFEFGPAMERITRKEISGPREKSPVFFPWRSVYYPGCLYLHDLVFRNGALLGASAGLNAVVRLNGDGTFDPLWWPQSLDKKGGWRVGRNHLQLNSIALGKTIRDSFFSASCAEPGRLLPGNPDFPVDRCGIIFSGKTRRPCGGGLTRPHSARFFKKDVWVDNSGYGEVGKMSDGHFSPAAKLPGWTRGLFFHGHIAFVGTSRVLKRFYKYAPGLDVRSSRCGIHALDTRSGKVLGSLYWPYGNQIFSIEGLAGRNAPHFPWGPGQRDKDISQKFYAYLMRRKK